MPADAQARRRGALDVKEAFSCFTADVISQYAFGEPTGFAAQEDMRKMV